jgi:hypothetical protein
MIDDKYSVVFAHTRLNNDLQGFNWELMTERVTFDASVRTHLLPSRDILILSVTRSWRNSPPQGGELRHERTANSIKTGQQSVSQRF